MEHWKLRNSKSSAAPWGKPGRKVLAEQGAQLKAREAAPLSPCEGSFNRTKDKLTEVQTIWAFLSPPCTSLPLTGGYFMTTSTIWPYPALCGFPSPLSHPYQKHFVEFNCSHYAYISLLLSTPLANSAIKTRMLPCLTQMTYCLLLLSVPWCNHSHCTCKGSNTV